MVEAALFIGTVIIAITELIKHLAPNIKGALSIVLAVVVGILVAVLDVHLGIEDITIAQGILYGLSGAGIVTVAHKARG